MSVTAGVSDSVIAIRDKLRGKIGQTKVKRYWPGKAPDWAEQVEEDHEFNTSNSLQKAFPAHDDGPLPRPADDRRLRRLAVLRPDSKDEARADRRRIRQAEILSTAEHEPAGPESSDLDEEDDENAAEERRRRLKEKLLLREKEEALPAIEEEDEVEEEEEEESEYETDEDEEEMGNPMVKPVFVPKAHRETIAERERVEDEERRLEELAKRRLEERRVESKQMVVEEIRRDEQMVRNLEIDEDVADVDTDDEMNEAEEYEAWKGREIARIRREREDREARVKEREEVERLRNMTEEERRELERKDPRGVSGGTKQKWRFMQKYYHKGAFFQSDVDDYATTAGTDEIYARDFSAPTGDDKMNKTILPKVMQVKHFGRSGRTKWTHLVQEDTTDWNTPYVNCSFFVVVC